MSDKFWESIFKSLSSDVLQWIASADGLRRSADLVFAACLEAHQQQAEDYSASANARTLAAATLLYGLAMENILKAALLKEGIAEVKEDGSIDWHSDGAWEHDLLSMCRSSKLVTLNPQQEQLMVRMSAFVHWAGKYPAPRKLRNTKTNKDFQGLVLSGQPDAASVTLPLEFRAEDKIAFDDIYDDLWKRAFPFDLGGVC